ncbi:hypothetical protein ACH4FX_37555 [Streptomyces sp. NPDC018019]|uniref:hypothetical protein n=1 Tax=Streptomyces sp. NPDC018019 TaxID=3365030 RepID=UPI0037B37A21
MKDGVPSGLYAALQVCIPGDGLPGWLTAAAPCCVPQAIVLSVGPARTEALADLVALAWWELLQDPGDDPFTAWFIKACAQHLS